MIEDLIQQHARIMKEREDLLASADALAVKAGLLATRIQELADDELASQGEGPAKLRGSPADRPPTVAAGD